MEINKNRYYINKTKLKKPLLQMLAVLVVTATLALFLMSRAGSIHQEQLINSAVENLTTVSFKETAEYLPNPFMGAVAFASGKTSEFEGTIAAGAFTWAQIEPEKGRFDFAFADAENNFHYWVHENNRQMMLTFMMDYPSFKEAVGYEDIDIPLWLYEELKEEAIREYSRLLEDALRSENRVKINAYEEALRTIKNDQAVIDDFNRSADYSHQIPGPGDRESATADIPGVGTFYRMSWDLPDGKVIYKCGFSPNYASPLLIKYHDRAMQAIAERYDNEKTYAIIMGSLGHWGEMHTTYIRDSSDTGRYPGIQVASLYEQCYADYFQNTLVSSRYPRKVALENNFGLHNHGFGDPQQTYDWFVDWYKNGYQDYFTKEYHPAMPGFWKTAPSGAEFLYTGDSRFFLDDLFAETMKQAEVTYLTWLLELWYELPPEGERNMHRLMGMIGYRFAITEAKFSTVAYTGGELLLVTEWHNGGTAPFYRDWPIVVQLRSPEGKIISEAVVSESVRSLFPGVRETHHTIINIPDNVPPGIYRIFTGIRNPDTGMAEIFLTMENVTVEDCMVLIGEVEVENHLAVRW